ncbi:MAG: hypothetical protein ABIJ56_20595, partial [Pseudomonadota bacterium]
MGKKKKRGKSVSGGASRKEPAAASVESGKRFGGFLPLYIIGGLLFAGAMHDPASAILLCGSGVKADATIVA